MALADSLKKAASKVLNAVGGDVTIRRVTTGAYNTTTGSIAETTADTVVKGLMEDVNAREVNELIQADDRRLTIAASSLTYTPTTADRIVSGGVNYQVIRVNTVSQSGVAINYILYLRA